MKPLAALIAGIALIGATSPQRESIGIYQGWGAFRDSPPTHCYAIAQPVRPRGSDAFAAIGDWLTLGRRGEVQFRLSRAARPGAAVTLFVGDRRFALIAKDRIADAPNPATDAAIVAAIRAGRSMRVAAVDRRGSPFADLYALDGAASAIDAAALACLTRQGTNPAS